MSSKDKLMFGAISNFMVGSDESEAGKTPAVNNKSGKGVGIEKRSGFASKRGRPRVGINDPRSGRIWKNTSIGVEERQWLDVARFAHDTYQPTIKHALNVLLRCALEEYRKDKKGFIERFGNDAD